ncbi:hypothetical protein [Rhodopila sp.]|uniref:hypothetical protein n=1 Tax=Rhodopila sp. TaxID=2480087 RepID=UPI003D0F2A34
MTTSTVFAVFEDFNDQRDEPAAPMIEDERISSEEVGEIRQAAWTEGYLTARQERLTHSGDRPLTATLLTAVHELEASTSEAVGAAALAMADLLVNTVIAATSENWSARLLERVRMVADRIKPALTVAPRFVLRDRHGTEQQFGDISDLSRVLEDGSGEDVTIRWHRGEAIISRTALLEDLRDAIIPLSVARADQQDARNLT